MTALFDVFPSLAGRVPWASLAELPTTVEAAPRVLEVAGARGVLWLKRDDRASLVYGGNKVRLLEPVLGEALARGFTEVYAAGARGSNFALATVLHAPRVGLAPGVVCFPQASTPEGEANQRLIEARARVMSIAHWSLLPLETERLRRRAERQGRRALVLPQVGLSGRALLGYLAAGLELAQQVEAGACPTPRAIVLPIGSAATVAGLAAGLALAQRLGMWRARLPTLSAVRIAPWPLSRRARARGLADKALAYVAALTGETSLRHAALPELEIVTTQLGAGYPHPTDAARQAQRWFADAGYPILDGTYSGKAAAHLFAMGTLERGPVLFWATKSSVPEP